MTNNRNAETVAIAYKSLDVDAMLNRNNTRESMRNSLLELDETWRRIYEKASNLTHKNASLLAASASKDNDIKALDTEKSGLEAKVKSLEHDSNSLVHQNRYLRKALKTYLYPAIANEILQDENVLEQVDTSVTPEAMSMLVDSYMPSSFSSSVNSDKRLISRESRLLERLSAQVRGGGDA